MEFPQPEHQLAEQDIKLIRKSGKLALILGWIQIIALPLVAYAPKLLQHDIKQEDFINQASASVAMGLFLGIYLIIKSRPLRKVEKSDLRRIEKVTTGIIIVLLLVAAFELVSGGRIAWLQILLAGWLVRSTRAIKKLKLPPLKLSAKELKLKHVQSAGTIALWVALSQASVLILDVGQLLIPPVDGLHNLILEVIFELLLNAVFAAMLIFVGGCLRHASIDTISKAKVSLWTLVITSVAYTALNIAFGTYLAPVPYLVLIFFIMRALKEMRGAQKVAQNVYLSRKEHL